MGRRASLRQLEMSPRRNLRGGVRALGSLEKRHGTYCDDLGFNILSASTFVVGINFFHTLPCCVQMMAKLGRDMSRNLRNSVGKDAQMPETAGKTLK